MNGFSTYEQFQSEQLRYRSGPLASAIEEIADEIYQGAYQDALDLAGGALDDDE